MMRPVSIAAYPPWLAWLRRGSPVVRTERLDARPPGSVNLTGEWQFNPNLSDDPDKYPTLTRRPHSAPRVGTGATAEAEAAVAECRDWVTVRPVVDGNHIKAPKNIARVAAHERMPDEVSSRFRTSRLPRRSCPGRLIA